MKPRQLLLAACAAVMLTSSLCAEDDHKHHKPHAEHDHKHDGQKHDNHKKTDHDSHKATCPVSGEALDDSAVAYTHNGKEFKFCCDKCLKKFKHHPGKYTKASSKSDYPLKTCVVSGEKLGSMGKPYEHEHNGHKVLFCCKGCLKKFNKAPGDFLKKVSDAKKKLHH